jgi:molecular chaperone HtpG
VDSEDLPLNISREILQKNRQVQLIRKGIIKKVLDTLKDMQREEREEYLQLWSEFGQVLKEGIYQDPDNRENLLELILSNSTGSNGNLTSLSEYLERMKPDQENIYYMTGESLEAVERSPHLEIFMDKGYEVLLLTNPVDELWPETVFEFKGKKFQSVGKGEVELGTEEEKKTAKEELEKKEKDYKSLLGCIQEKLEKYVKEVRLSSRLTSSPACLVTERGELTPQMEQLLRSTGQKIPEVKRILEINPNHQIVEKMQKKFEENKDDEILSDYAELLYGQSLLAEGHQPPDPGKFGKLVAELMVKAI